MSHHQSWTLRRDLLLLLSGHFRAGTILTMRYTFNSNRKGPKYKAVTLLEVFITAHPEVCDMLV